MTKAISLFFILFFCSSFKAQIPSDVVLTDFIRESQQWVRKDGRMALTWWIATDYWRIALSDNTQIPKGSIEKIETVFENYALICASDMKIASDGSATFKSDNDIRKTISITDQSGKKYLPLNDDKISAEAKTISASIEPMFAQVLGQMGQGMHIYFFEVQDDKKQNIINATKKGSFKVSHSGDEFNWVLPMTTLLPSKLCPTDNEKMKGNWCYCPIHGVKLK